MNRLISLRDALAALHGHDPRHPIWVGRPRPRNKIGRIVGAYTKPRIAVLTRQLKRKALRNGGRV